jgi:hypothetical protein
MTVAELIEELEKLDQDKEVITKGSTGTFHHGTITVREGSRRQTKGKICLVGGW